MSALQLGDSDPVPDVPQILLKMKRGISKWQVTLLQLTPLTRISMRQEVVILLTGSQHDIQASPVKTTHIDASCCVGYMMAVLADLASTDVQEKLALLDDVTTIAAADPGQIANPAQADAFADTLTELSGKRFHQVW